MKPCRVGFQPAWNFISISLSLLLAVTAFAQSLAVPDLHGTMQDPFQPPAQARVFLFVRSDCPITNRYAPELQRLSEEFKSRGVQFWLVYPDRAETPASIEKHVQEYQLPGKVLRDPERRLIKLARASVAPEAAVFNKHGQLIYHGRIDDRYVEIGKSRPGGPQTHDLENAIEAALSGKPVVPPETAAIGCSLADLQ